MSLPNIGSNYSIIEKVVLDNYTQRGHEKRERKMAIYYLKI